MLPYIYTPRPGEHIKIDRRGGGTDDAHVSVWAQGAGSIAVPAADALGVASDFARAICAAAGKPEPVILDRPEVAADGDGSTGINIFTVKLEPDLRSLGIRYHGAPNRAIIAPGPARVLASVIAAYADAGQAHQDEPDPAEVEELAAAIRAQLHPASGKPSEADRTAARAALRYLRDKQQRGETR